MPYSTLPTVSQGNPIRSTSWGNVVRANFEDHENRILDLEAGEFAGQYGSFTYDAGNSGTALTLNWNNGNTQLVTLTGACTLTLSNPKNGFRYLIVLKQDATGSRTVTWPSSVKWPGGTAPTLSTAAGKVDIVTLVWMSGLGASGNYLAASNTDYTPA